LGLDEYESNFVTAMSVFGNSNSLPVSLTLTLAYTLPNLEWDDVEDDDPSKVASRGLLYLLIFQQIGQVLRWSWGYNTLLKRRPEKIAADQTLLSVQGLDVEQDYGFIRQVNHPHPHSSSSNNGFSSATLTDYSDGQYNNNEAVVGGGGSNNHNENNDNASSTSSRPSSSKSSASVSDRLLGDGNTDDSSDSTSDDFTSSSPSKNFFVRSFKKFQGAMNPPLYAMLASVIVASVPQLHDELFVNDGFIQNTVVEAIRQLSIVSIPLILIVLGSNLYPSHETPPPSVHYKRIVFGSLVSRMIIPPIILLPLIALIAKYVKVSIIDDPIFLVVSFILTISPPAIQLSQICQLNDLFEMEMAGVLFWGYVVLTLPTTIFVVAASLQVLNWGKGNFA
jgi:predicted permease